MYFLLVDEQQVGPFTLEQLRIGWKEGAYRPDTLFWQDGMADWQLLETIQPLIEASPVQTGLSANAPGDAPMVIAGFWRRLAAFLVDVLIIGIVGFGSGYFLFHFYMALGLAGILLGLFVATAYFGLLNSRLGSGQTLGKRLLGIRVGDKNGDFISPARSVLRYLILAFPFFLNKALTDGLVSDLTYAALVMFPVLAGFASLTYLLIFNRRTRQMIHDLMTGTYVVRTSSPRPAVSPVMWHGHAIIVGILCVLIAGLGCLTPFFLRAPFFQQMLTVRQAIMATGKVRTASVMGGTTYVASSGHTGSTRVYSIMAKVKGHPGSSEMTASEFAGLALKADPAISTYDRLDIAISYGYDIGIASGTVTDAFSHTPAEWKIIADHSATSP